MSSGGGKTGGKGGSGGDRNLSNAAQLNASSSQGRLKFIENALAQDPGLSPNFILHMDAGPVIIDIEEFHREKPKINKPAKFDTLGGAVPTVLLRMAVEIDGKIGGKEISGKLCELLTTGHGARRLTEPPKL